MCIYWKKIVIDFKRRDIKSRYKWNIKVVVCGVDRGIETEYVYYLLNEGYQNRFTTRTGLSLTLSGDSDS